MLARPMCGFCDNLAPVAAFLHTWLPDNAHEVASGRLHIAVSSWPMLGMRFLSKFHSKGELVDAIVASCFFPGFVARPRFSCHKTWTGTWFDAGLQNMATPIDYRMDLPVRAFPVPVCASCVAVAMPCYYGPPPVSSLGPTGDAVHPGGYAGYTSVATAEKHANKMPCPFYPIVYSAILNPPPPFSGHVPVDLAKALDLM